MRQPYIESVTPNSSVSGTLTYRNNAFTAQVRGVSEQYFNVKGIQTVAGQLFSGEQVKQNQSVAVIDQNTQKRIFQDRNPLGQIIMINKKPLKVIGIVDIQNVMGVNRESLNIWIPYTTAMNKISGEKKISSITVKVNQGISTSTAEKNVTALLLSRHGKKDFFILNTDSIKQTIESTTNTMKLLISSIALISLIVGGIGVMNIMLVSVTERTKEIGVRMAIGAKQQNILQQFLIEAVLVCLVGGIIGIILSGLIGFLFNRFMSEFTMLFSTFSIVVAVLCSTLIGIIFGYVPAKNAAKLNPITALSQE